MENFSFKSSDLKVPMLFLDIMSVSVGFLLILFLSFIYYKDLHLETCLNFFDSFAKIFAVFAVAFVGGRSLEIIARIYVGFIRFLFSKNRNERFSKSINNFSLLINQDKYSFSFDKDLILSPEMHAEVEKSSFTKASIERIIYNIFFIKLLIGFTIVMLFVKFFIFTPLILILLTLVYFSAKIEEVEMKKEIAMSVRKNQLKSDN